ncbi:MAG: hypothetical protein WA431_13815 [Candidatus Cybelea sp.]|jgi:hypothetical protein
MAPGTSGQDLLYVAAWPGHGAVYVYSYPKSHLVGTLTGFYMPFGECSDSSGDVFVVALANSSSRSSTIYEYAHGGTSPIATLSDPDFAWGCAVDPLTGNLAVSGGISVAIYQHASGAPTIYSNSEFHFFYCGYDDRGNLYLSSNDYRYADRAQLVRLASGSNQFEQVDLSRKVYTGQVLPSVQWDGNHMTISSDIGREPISIYRLRISGSAGTVVGTTTIRSQKNVYSGQMWIQGSTFLGAGNDPGDRGQKFFFWRYPKGGAPYRTIRNLGAGRVGSREASGVTVSVAAPR